MRNLGPPKRVYADKAGVANQNPLRASLALFTRTHPGYILCEPWPHRSRIPSQIHESPLSVLGMYIYPTLSVYRLRASWIPGLEAFRLRSSLSNNWATVILRFARVFLSSSNTQSEYLRTRVDFRKRRRCWWDVAGRFRFLFTNPALSETSPI